MDSNSKETRRDRIASDGGGDDPSPEDGKQYRLRIFLNREIKDAIYKHIIDLKVSGC